MVMIAFIKIASQNVNGATHYFGYDGLGSTKFLTAQDGSITDTYQYDAYGEVTSQTGNTDNLYLYTGEQYDRSLNQYYLRARYYNQGVGRFTQMDSWQGRASNPTTLNKYLYADGAPTIYTDPSGHMSIGGMMSTINTMSTLHSVAITSYDIFSSTQNGTGMSAKDIGMAIIIGGVGGAAGDKILKGIARKICKKKNCKVPVLDVRHIFYGEIRRNKPKGFHSLAMINANITFSAARPYVDEVKWTNLNGVYKAKVQIPHSGAANPRTNVSRFRYRSKLSTMFPDHWNSTMVGASLYLSWIRNKGRNQGSVNLGIINIQYHVDGGLIHGYPTR